MESVAQQSFIPHETSSITRPPRPQGRGLADLLVLASIVLSVASTALAAGVFLYGEYLQKSATSKVDQLKRAEAAFEPSLIHELTRLDDRMRAAGEVLGNHIAPTAFFKMLEQTTITTVAFTTLDFNTADLGHMAVKMNGIAGSVNSIALQADLFSKGGMITSPIFSDIDREVDGVHFSLSALLNPQAINFTQLVMASLGTQEEVPSSNNSPFDGSATGENQKIPQAVLPEQ